MPLLYFDLKSFLDPSSSSFIRFQCTLHDSGDFFSECGNFFKWKTGDLISRWNKFWRMSELFGPFFWISFLKLFLTEILPHSFHFNVSSWFRSTFLSVLKFQEIKDGQGNFWGERILQNVSNIWSLFLYFNLKSSMDPNFFPFIRFQSFQEYFSRSPEISTNQRWAT